MSAKSVSMACPVCGSRKQRPVVRIADAPVLCNFLYPSREEAKSVGRGTIELVFCLHCGHLYNRAFDRNLLRYRPGYDNALHYSGRYRQYAEEEARRLLARFRLAGRRVVDIGCGDGAFLKLFQQLGLCEGIGFEPSFDRDANPALSGSTIKIIPETFSGSLAAIGADLYVARHVLEHLADPQEFLQTIRSAMDSDRSVLFLEVPDGAALLAQGSVWDIIYEHVSCFTAPSLGHLLRLTDFSPDPPRSVFSGQYLAVDAFPAKSSLLANNGQFRDTIAKTGRLLEGFRKHATARRERTEKLLKEELRGGRRAVVWGAGSKGITFLNSLPAGVDIPFIIDINPGKQGKFVPGSGQQVMGPESLIDYRPDTIFIVNNIYREEIRALLDGLKIAARIHCL
jgi:SAM-dependent methyltransferase